MSKSCPIIGISANFKIINKRPKQTVRDKYIEAVLQTTNAMPLIIPTIGDRIDIQHLLQIMDGFILTGSSSHLHPSHYGQNPMHLSKNYDLRRDATTLPLIPAILDAGKPLLTICRGFHELNIAHGGSLHQELHEIDGLIDHRQPHGAKTYQDNYKPQHDVVFTQGGRLHKLTGKTGCRVNSLHHQGIKDLGKGLVVEATASDGAIEAIRVKGAKSFAMGMQWHPEWLLKEDDGVSESIFAAFFKAIKSNKNK